jgi:hypothetical protein
VTTLLVSCTRCALEHPDRRPTPLAVLEAPETGGPALLYRAERFGDRVHSQDLGRPVSFFGSSHAPEPMAERADAPVHLRCRACGKKSGPYTAKAIAKAFRDGKAHENVLLLPPTPAGQPTPRPPRWPKVTPPS